MRHETRAAVLLLGVLGLAPVMAGCAARTPPPPAAAITPKYPDFVFPRPDPSANPIAVERQDRAWRYLQTGDLRNAERAFADVLEKEPDFPPAESGLGYVELARREPARALARFDRALEHNAQYAPALAGRGQTLLALERHAEALESFEAAMVADPSLDFGSRITVLRLRGVQDQVGSARRALQRGDIEQARAGYTAAMRASPDTGFLHRELATVEQRAGDLEAAVTHYRRAVELDPADAKAQTGLGTVLESRGDFKGALAAYTAAASIDPSAGLDERIKTLNARVAAASLPPEYGTIPASPFGTRAGIAALLGVRMADWLQRAAPRQGVLVTDTRGHWAAKWIVTVVRAGIMDPFPNHTFQPDQRLSRGDLAVVVSRMLNLIAAQRRAAPAAWQTARPAIADVPMTHPAYPAVAPAVASGVLSLDAGVFHLTTPVTGSDLVRVIERLQALGSTAPGTARP
jgi:tetratricopeptide (TPR) repeat protein